MGEEKERERIEASAIDKLLKKQREVSICSRMAEISEARKVVERLKSAGGKENLEQGEVWKKQIEEWEKERIEGILTPILYKEQRQIMGAISEAVIEGRRNNFDDRVIDLMAEQERMAMTVYYALKSKSDEKSRVFFSLDEFSKLVSLPVVKTIYDEYEKEFVLTKDEKKTQLREA